MYLKLVIVGRPNVGKSTLFNKIIKKKIALVDDQAGVTRDIRESIVKFNEFEFLITDTAGFDLSSKINLQKKMNDLSFAAIKNSNICIFLTDLKSGITSDDYLIADRLRKLKKNVFLVVNKSDVKTSENNFYDFYELGFGEPIRISAEHNIGLDFLFDKINDFYIYNQKFLETDNIENANYSDCLRTKIVVIGQPNSGKSSLVNSILGVERLLTGPEAGITRDSISVDFSWKKKPVTIFDTAGMRKKSKIIQKLEKISVNDTLKAIRFADLVLLIIDSTLPFENQDLRIASLTEREGRALIVVLNKIDLIKNKDEFYDKMCKKIDFILPKVKGTPVVVTSAIKFEGLDALYEKVTYVESIWNKRVSTSKLNEWLIFTCQKHPPPAIKGKRIKLRYITQIKNRPPTFVVFISIKNSLQESYKRYLVNSLRENFSFKGVPLRMIFKAGKNPYSVS